MQASTRKVFGAGCSAVLAGLLATTGACGDGTATPPSRGAGSSQAGTAGLGTAGAAPATAGTSSVGGQVAQPVTGGAGQSGAGSGGAPPNTGGAAPAASGSGGSSAGSGGTASAGASPVDDTAALAPLHGYQLLDPCDLSNYKVEASAGAVCPQTNSVKNQHQSRTLAGDPDVTYDVTLRVRGIVERYWYEGGTLDPVSKVFYTGGVPTVGGFASACKNKASELPFQLPPEVSPSDGCFNGFNVFAMTVSAPKQHFYLNYTADKSGDRPPHAVYSQDYTVTVAMQGQAKLDFYIIGSDEHQCYNHDQVIDGVTLTRTPYIGEFLQFDVLKVTRRAQ